MRWKDRSYPSVRDYDEEDERASAIRTFVEPLEMHLSKQLRHLYSNSLMTTDLEPMSLTLQSMVLVHLVPLSLINR